MEFLLPVVGLGAGVAIARSDAWVAQARSWCGRPRPAAGAEAAPETYKPLGPAQEPANGWGWGLPPEVLPPVLARSTPPAGGSGGAGRAGRRPRTSGGRLCQRCHVGAAVQGLSLSAEVDGEVIAVELDLCAVCQDAIHRGPGRAA